MHTSTGKCKASTDKCKHPQTSVQIHRQVHTSSGKCTNLQASANICRCVFSLLQAKLPCWFLNTPSSFLLQGLFLLLCLYCISLHIYEAQWFTPSGSECPSFQGLLSHSIEDGSHYPTPLLHSINSRGFLHFKHWQHTLPLGTWAVLLGLYSVSHPIISGQGKADGTKEFLKHTFKTSHLEHSLNMNGALGSIPSKKKELKSSHHRVGEMLVHKDAKPENLGSVPRSIR